MFTRLKSKVTEAVNERVLKPMAGSSALTNQAEVNRIFKNYVNK